MTRRLTTAFATLLLVSALVGGGFAAATGGVAAQTNETDASLTIEQPHYVGSDVDVDTTGNYTTYTLEGVEHNVKLDNVGPNATVIDYGIEEDEGSLSEHSAFDYYRFTADSDGTYHAYFVVETEETTTANNTTTTETVRERRVAQLDVSKTDQQAVGGDRLSDLQESANKWDDWTSTVTSIAGEGADIARQTELAGTLLDLRHNPSKALTGGFLGMFVALFITLSGLAILALFGLYHLWTTRSLRKRTNERESLEVEEADLEEKLIELDDKERNQILVNTTLLDVLEDEWSGRAMHEDLGEDAMSAWLNFSQLVGAGNLLHDRLLAMGKDGYQAAVRTDGGEDGGTITDARLVHPNVDAELAADESLVDLAEDEETAGSVADVIDITDTALVEYDLTTHDGRLADMGPTLESPDSVDELVADLDADLRRFQDNEEVYAQFLLEFVEHVREHPFTDADGRPKATRYVLSSWLKTAQINRDIFNLPLSEMHVEYLEKLLADRDPSEDADIELEKQQKGVTTNAAD